MKRLTLSIAVCLTVSLLSGLQAQRPGGQGQGSGGQTRTPPFMRIFDTDQNGELSTDEIQNAASALMKLDKDGDGKLTPQEMRPPAQAGPRGQGGMSGPRGQGGQRGPGAGQGRPGQQGQPQRGGRGAGGAGGSLGGGPGGGRRGGDPRQADADFADEVLTFDANKDGLLSLDELPEHMHHGFGIADANHNGSLDADERLVLAGQFGRKKLQPGGEGLEMKNRPTQGRRQ